MKFKLVALSQKPVAGKDTADSPLQATGYRLQAGFTLVEMIVAVALFTVVMLVSVGALLSLVGASRKAQALQSVMNNLNVALDGMVRSIRMGSDYSCGFSSGSGDCSTIPGTAFSFKPFCSGGSCSATERWIYVFDESGTLCGENTLCKKEGNVDYYAITAPEVDIESMGFYVVGSEPGDDETQPKVVMVITGTAGGGSVKVSTTFSIQATAVQRVLDI